MGEDNTTRMATPCLSLESNWICGTTRREGGSQKDSGLRAKYFMLEESEPVAK